MARNTTTEKTGTLERHSAEGLEQSQPAYATLGGRLLLPNRGVPLNLDWVEDVRVNTSAVERRAQTIVTRRTVKKEWQEAWLLRAITCMDLTTLSGDDTNQRVLRLCAKGRNPVQQSILQKLHAEELGISGPPMVNGWKSALGPLLLPLKQQVVNELRAAPDAASGSQTTFAW